MVHEPKQTISLPAEVWLKVSVHLQRPTPPPTGKNERSSIRQPELAVLMRVNKILNNVAAALLYDTVITDDFLSLTYGIDLPPVAKDIPSKRDLLFGSRRLCLEYCSKDEPTDNSLLRNGGATFYLVGGDASPLMVGLNIKAETDRHAEAWRRYNVALAGMARYRPPAISTGAYLDPQSDLYWRAMRVKAPVPGLNESELQAQGGLTPRAAHAPTCQRAAFGSLTFAAFAVAKGTVPMHVAHVNLRISTVAICMGGRISWYLPFELGLPDGDDPSDPGTIDAVGQLCESVASAAVDRAHKWLRILSEHGASRLDLPTDTTIYLTGSLSTPLVLEGLAEHVGPELLKLYKIFGIPPTRHTKDIWRFCKMEEAPPCPACHWSYDTHVVHKVSVASDECATFPLHADSRSVWQVLARYLDLFERPVQAGRRHFYAIASPLLYSVIVCDDLPTLLYGTNVRPAASGLQSKRQLLGTTKRLALEYCSKAEPIYSTILGQGRSCWSFVGGADPRAKAEYIGAESDWLGEGMEKLKALVPKMTALSTGAYLDPQRLMRYDANRIQPPVPSLDTRQLQTRSVLSTLGGSADICQGVASGPLAFAAIARVGGEPSPDDPVFTAHLDLGLGQMPIIMGRIARWYVPFVGGDIDNISGPDPGPEQAVHRISSAIAGHAVDRMAAWQQMGGGSGAMPDPPISVHIYVSGSLAATAVMAGMGEHLGGKIRQLYTRMGVPKTRHAKDVWKFCRIEEAPQCKSCGWNYDTYLATKSGDGAEHKKARFPLAAMNAAFQDMTQRAMRMHGMA